MTEAPAPAPAVALTSQTNTTILSHFFVGRLISRRTLHPHPDPSIAFDLLLFVSIHAAVLFWVGPQISLPVQSPRVFKPPPPSNSSPQTSTLQPQVFVRVPARPRTLTPKSTTQSSQSIIMGGRDSRSQKRINKRARMESQVSCHLTSPTLTSIRLPRHHRRHHMAVANICQLLAAQDESADASNAEASNAVASSSSEVGPYLSSPVSVPVIHHRPLVILPSRPWDVKPGLDHMPAAGLGLLAPGSGSSSRGSQFSKCTKSPPGGSCGSFVRYVVLT